MYRFALIITLALSAATAAFAQTPPPASAFGRLPAIQDADITPDGRRIMMLGGAPERRAVTIATVDSPQLQTLDLGPVETLSVGWASNDRAIIRIRYWQKIDAKYDYHFTRNVVIDPNGKVVSQLLDRWGPQSYGLSQPVVGIAETPELAAMVLAPDWNLAQRQLGTRIFSDEDKDALRQALWRVDLETGAGRVEERGIAQVYSWGVDKAGDARVRLEIDDDTRTWRVFGRPKGSSAWKLLVESKDEDDVERYLGYSDADDAIYLLDETPDGRNAIVRRKLADGSIEQVATFDAGADLWWDAYTDRPVVVESGFGLPTTQWLDAELGSVEAGLRKALGGPAALWAWSEDRKQFLVRVSAPDRPAEWYLYDKARKELSPVGEEYPELKGAALGKTSTVTYKARDGLDIPAYVTLPPGASAGQKLPLVVLPHGGPASLDGYDFDWLTHFIASRGYVVLRPQFRGSGGLGRDFEVAGRKEWGGKIQTDLLDGVAYLAGQGTIDPSRVCIVGSSFGGYSALAGATLQSSAYRCAASINGISDLPTMLGEKEHTGGEDSFGLRYWRRVMGEASADGRLLADTSPARKVTAATPPILLVVSEQDTTVAPAQSARMRTALETARRPVEYVTLENDDHYLMTTATRVKMLDALGRFLATHLPVSP